jgi:iron complex outermembrane receptor protein
MRNAILVAVALVPMAAWTQDATVKGRVIEATTKETLAGVNVVYAPGKGTATEIDGTYTLILPAGSHTLAFTSMGHTRKQVAVTLAPGETRTLDVSMDVAAAQLDAVVVTAGRFEQRVGEVTQSLSVIQPELFLNKNTITLDKALEQVAGVVIVDEEPQIRAGSGFSYGAGSRVQVMVDDMPVLSGDIGRPNWNLLPIENLEQVEVIKGASSVLYGSAALSGTINVRTAYPRATPRTRVNMFSGVYDTPGHVPAKWWGDNAPLFTGFNFFHSRQVGNLDVVLGGNAFGDMGHIGPERIRPDSLARDPFLMALDGFQHQVRTNLGLRWRHKRVQGLNYGINANALKSRATTVFIWDDTDRGLFRSEPGTTTLTRATQYYVDPYLNYYSQVGTRHTVRGRVFRQIFDNNNEQSNSNRSIFGEYQIQQEADIWGRTVLTGGISGQRVDSDSELYRGDPDADGRNNSSSVGAYLQLDKKLLRDRIALSTGVRYEQFKVNDYEAGQPVFRAGATWQALEATYVRASYGQGFRFPTIGERYITTNVGALTIMPNPDLRPERGTNLEAGVKQGFRIGKFMGYLDGVVFRQDFRDFVEFTFGQWRAPTAQIIGGQLVLDPGLGFMSRNTGRARVTGYEFEVTGKGTIGKLDILLMGGYTSTLPVSLTPDEPYAFGVVTGAPITQANTSYDNTDNILKWRIQRMFRTDMQFMYGRLHWGFSVRYNSHVRNLDRIFVDLDESPSDLVSLRTGLSQWMRDRRTGDTIVDARAGVSVSESTRVSFIVNNLTNEVYSLRPLRIEQPRSMQVQVSVAL